MNPLRWGFLGAGFIATEALAPAMTAAPSADLVAVASRNLDRAGALAPEARLYDNYGALIDDPEVDAIYVALSNDAHLPWTLKALAAGKHVLCEKPLGLDCAQVQDMFDAAAQADRLLVEASWNRWHPRTARALKILGSGEFGTPTRVNAAFSFRGVAPENYRWQAERGGGALYDVGCYAVAGSLAALGWPTLTGLTTHALRVDSGVDASTTAHLQFTDADAEIRASIDGDEEQRFVVTTDLATVELSSPPFTNWHEASLITITMHGSGEIRTEYFEPCDPYALMVDAVSRRACGDGDAWVVPPDESLRVAAVLDAIRSAQDG